MTWQNLERKVWRMWKDKYTLSRMARELSRLTMWSQYLSMCFIVDYLHNKKGIGFSRKQLRYAFGKLPKDEIPPEERAGAWAWLLHEGGYENRRGKKSSQRGKGNTPMLSSLNPKTAVSEGKEVKAYN